MDTTPPERPSLDGLEERWAARWEAAGTYSFDRSRPRAEVFAIDSPPLTVSGSLHVGHVLSYTHTDLVARYRRMRGSAVFYPVAWDDNGLPTERRVQAVFGVRCDPALPYDPDFRPPSTPDSRRPVPVSRRGFVELCRRLAADDEAAFAAVWRRLGLSVDWSLAYSTIDERSRRTSQLGFLRDLARGDSYRADGPTLWDVDLGTAVAQAELVDREVDGAWHTLDLGPASVAPERDRGLLGESGESAPPVVTVDTTRPELLPACVAVVAHPQDPRYAGLVGRTVRTPVFGVEVPVLAHRLADPELGTGLVMVCTFGDLTDVTWWRELALPTRPVVGRDGRLLPEPPPGVPAGPYAELAGLTVTAARRRVVDMLREAGALRGEPRPVRHTVAFHENGRRPLEIVASGQWYVRNGGRDPALRDALLRRGRELRWHPEWMRARYEDWVRGLSGDWLVSRQRFFGVPIPVWYALDAGGEPDHARPLVPAESGLPVDPAVDCPPGYDEDQRDQPGGFTGEPDVLDTWATSSLTPQIVGGWAGDPDLLGRVFPYDLRPQAHEIIRTWLFATVLRSHLEFDRLPWTDAAISGWVLDPGRRKMSKSVGNVVTPAEPLERFGADAVRYWAAQARLGVDTTWDTGQLRVGRRLATKLLNVSRFVLGLPDPGTAAPTAAVDRAALGRLAGVVAAATAAFDRYDHAEALARTEAYAWEFCDDHVELVKSRAYGAVGAEGRCRPRRGCGPRSTCCCGCWRRCCRSSPRRSGPGGGRGRCTGRRGRTRGRCGRRRAASTPSCPSWRPGCSRRCAGPRAARTCRCARRWSGCGCAPTRAGRRCCGTPRWTSRWRPRPPTWSWSPTGTAGARSRSRSPRRRTRRRAPPVGAAAPAEPGAQPGRPAPVGVPGVLLARARKAATLVRFAQLSEQKRRCALRETST
jgi:valyl-tRNA synthetase